MKLTRASIYFLLLLTLLAAACSPTLNALQEKVQTQSASTQTPSATATLVTQDPEVIPTKTPVPAQGARIWLGESVPPRLRQEMVLADGVRFAETEEGATISYDVTFNTRGVSQWVYALAAPFPTTADGVSEDDLRAAWKGRPSGVFGDKPLMMSAETKAAFDRIWGPGNPDLVVLPGDELLDAAWADRPSWAIVPIEELEPRWKVLKIDGHSPLDKTTDLNRYPLVVRFGLSETPSQEVMVAPETNLDHNRMTMLVMTGVTALVRSTGQRMETFGMNYPAEGIYDWLRFADLTHISNEVSFEPACPPANPNQTELIFCSRPEYIQLLEYIGADVIELSGNHLMDWTLRSMPYSLEMYAERGMKVYASGHTLEEARAPLEVEHNGNHLAFVGCNPAGPPTVWATETSPGVADCDWEWLQAEVSRLKEAGAIPIVTLQYYESYTQKPNPQMQRDFKALSAAGAAIVSGSQAHYPMGFDFVDGRFIHYGLGNLFFDQMYVPEGIVYRKFNPEELPIPGTRLEFLDRHYFYEGRHISTEVLTAVLEDWAQPRPMTPDERMIFLRDTFKSSGW